MCCIRSLTSVLLSFALTLIVATVKPTQYPTPVTLSPTVPTLMLTNVSTIGVTAGASPIYVATNTGLYRSASSTYAAWTRQNVNGSIVAISPNERNSSDVVYATGDGIYRSADGGQVATRAARCGVMYIQRAPSDPTVLYATSRAINQPCHAVDSAQSASYRVASVLKSTDDGVTWTTSYTAAPAYDVNSEGFGPLAVDPANPNHVAVSYLGDHGWGSVSETRNGGQTWHNLRSSPLQFNQAIPTGISDVAFDPLRPADLWISWRGGFDAVDLGELDRGHSLVSAGLPRPPASWPQPQLPLRPGPERMAFDPLTGRLYVLLAPSPTATAPTHLFAIGQGDDRFIPFVAPVSVSERSTDNMTLAVTSNGYLLSGGSHTPLAVTAVISSGAWTVSAPLASYHTADRTRLLGSPIAPPSRCNGFVCQYFDKGVLERQGQTAYRYAPLVTQLRSSNSALPVGGDHSTVTYRTLRDLSARRVPPPSGFQGGTASVDGGTFVPTSPRLAASPGYVVPAFFWTYMTTGRNAPDGWLNDVGVPLTSAISARVTKRGVGQRTIILQAFEKAILTYDPQNPAAWRVERSNVGLDYAQTFPQAVR